MDGWVGYVWEHACTGSGEHVVDKLFIDPSIYPSSHPSGEGVSNLQRVGNEMQIINQMAEEGKEKKQDVEADKARLGQDLPIQLLPVV